MNINPLKFEITYSDDIDLNEAWRLHNQAQVLQTTVDKFLRGLISEEELCETLLDNGQNPEQVAQIYQSNVDYLARYSGRKILKLPD